MTTSTLTRRAPRRARPVDLDLFTATVDAALTAFGQDVSYAVAMARAAVVIVRKRDGWTAHRDRGPFAIVSCGRDTT